MPERFVPYIYNADELQKLINPASPEQIGFRKLQPHTLRTVLLLLYGAGLRVGEAVALTLQDVDLDAAVITIRRHEIPQDPAGTIGLKLNQDDGAIRGTTKRGWPFAKSRRTLLRIAPGRVRVRSHCARGIHPPTRIRRRRACRWRPLSTPPP